MSFLKQYLNDTTHYNNQKASLEAVSVLNQNCLHVPGQHYYIDNNIATESKIFNLAKLYADYFYPKIAKVIFNRYIREHLTNLHSPNFTSKRNINYLLGLLDDCRDGIRYGNVASEVSAKGLLKYFIYKGDYLTTEAEISNAYKNIIQDISKIEKGVYAFVNDLSKLTVDEEAFKEADGETGAKDYIEKNVLPALDKLFNKHLPNNLRETFTPKGEMPDDKTIEGCNEPFKYIKLTEASTKVFMDMHEALTELKVNGSKIELNVPKSIEGVIKRSVQDVFFTVINQYFSFISKHVEWMKRSIVFQSKEGLNDIDSVINSWAMEGIMLQKKNQLF